MTEADSKVIAPAMQSKKRSTKKLTTAEFIARAKAIHGDKYDYSQVIYIGMQSKVKIICPDHGVFEQSPSVHIHKGGCGCPVCWQDRQSVGKMLPFKEVVGLAREKHGDRFEYIEKSYRGVKYKVLIICPDHGVFEQRLCDHIRSAHGCIKCSGLHVVTKSEFIAKAKVVHGDRYNYSLVEYDGSKVRVKIICPEHGLFEQMPSCHINQKQGCPSCGNIKKGLSQRVEQDEFLRRAKQIHPTLNFTKSTYQGNNRKVVVACDYHGDFKIKPMHLIDRGQGCPECGRENVGWGLSSYVALAKQFHGGLSKIYVVEMSYGGELFYKVGITFHNVKHRFRGHCPYGYKEVLSVEGAADFVWSLEKQIHRILKKYSYTPKIDFAGKTECFSYIPKEVYRLLGSIEKSNQLQLIA